MRAAVLRAGGYDSALHTYMQYRRVLNLVTVSAVTSGCEIARPGRIVGAVLEKLAGAKVSVSYAKAVNWHLSLEPRTASIGNFGSLIECIAEQWRRL